MQSKNLLVRGAIALAVLGLVYAGVLPQSALEQVLSGGGSQTQSSPAPAPAPRESGSRDAVGGGVDFARLFAARQSDTMVESTGVVIKVLPDDNKGSRHQRFILDVGADNTILIAHNIDLAPRIDGLQRGDKVGFKGEYEWNERGGVVHWTHHDPAGRHPGGWLRHQGKLYE